MTSFSAVKRESKRERKTEGLRERGEREEMDLNLGFEVSELIEGIKSFQAPIREKKKGIWVILSPPTFPFSFAYTHLALPISPSFSR